MRLLLAGRDRWLVLLAALAVFGLGMVGIGHRYMAAYGVHDPGAIVVDEVVGRWLTLALLPLTPIAYLAGFVLFRHPPTSGKTLRAGWIDRRMAGRHWRDARRRGRGHLCGAGLALAMVVWLP